MEQLPVSKKRVLRLMRKQHLVVTLHRKLKAKRTSTRSQPRPTKPNAQWGIDMTKVAVEGFGWVYILLVVDWYITKIVGYHAGSPCTASHWLTALDMAVNRHFAAGARGQDADDAHAHRRGPLATGMDQPR